MALRVNVKIESESWGKLRLDNIGLIQGFALIDNGCLVFFYGKQNENGTPAA